MAELDPQIPLSYLRGDYTQNYFKDSPLSSMMDTYLNTRKNQQLFDEIERKKAAFKNVASARKGVESKYNEKMFNTAESEQTKALNDQIIAKQSELDAIDKELDAIDKEIAEINSQINSLGMVGYKPNDNTQSEQATNLMTGYTEQQNRNPSYETLTGGNI